MLVIVDMWNKQWTVRHGLVSQTHHHLNIKDIIKHMIINYPGPVYQFNSDVRKNPPTMFDNIPLIEDDSELVKMTTDPGLLGTKGKVYLCGQHLGRCIDDVAKLIDNSKIVLNASVVHYNDILMDIYDDNVDYVWYNYKDSSYTDIKVRF